MHKLHFRCKLNRMAVLPEDSYFILADQSIVRGWIKIQLTLFLKFQDVYWHDIFTIAKNYNIIYIHHKMFMPCYI